MIAKSGRQRTVLVVEDDPFSRELMAELLTEEDYDVVLARSGEEGLVQVGRARPDAMVLDLALPRLSGLDLLHEVRGNASTADIPVIVVSAYALHLQDQDLAHVDAAIQKPFTVEQILSAVDTAVHRAAAPNLAPAH